MVPKLEEAYGLVALPVTTLDAKMVVQLKDFDFYELNYVPHQRHSFYINDMGGRKETAENYHGGREVAAHSILQCRTTGLVLDLTLGQLTGEMKPGVFASYQKYEEAFPGRILRKMPRTFTKALKQERATHQIVFDDIRAMSPEFSPVPFGARVVRQIMKEDSGYKKHCHMCLGLATTSSDGVRADLKRYSACHQVWYCDKACQVLHWKKEHKESCTVGAGKKE